MARILFAIILLLPSISAAFMSEKEIVTAQAAAVEWPVGDRIAFWAERFVGTPYDPDPLGEYVRANALVADVRVDCMYLTFRVAELSFSTDAEGAVRIALDKRFQGRGILQDGKIVNYQDRFQYGEDMLDSGKWGREITGELGGTLLIAGSRGRPQVRVLSRAELQRSAARLRNGDLVFFVRDPAKRLSDEIVGHIGIIREEANKVYLIHASGLKNRGGRVKKTLLTDYLKIMPFKGARVSRFDPETPMPE